MATEQGRQWPVGIRIRPAATGDDAIELADVVANRRFRWDPAALAGAIIDQAEAADGSALDRWLEATTATRAHVPDAASWRHWRERSWRPSDAYYVASRAVRYADATDPDAVIRTRALAGYLESGGPVPEHDPEPLAVVELGDPAPLPAESLGSVLVRRRSGRSYVRRPVGCDVLSGTLWHGFADVRRRRRRVDPAVPLSLLDSFGSAWDVYVAVFDVTGVPPGVYKYALDRHELLAVATGDRRREFCAILQGQRPPATAAWTVVLVADFPRYQWRYRHEHALRKLYLESGILGQEVVLVGTLYGLATLVTPAQRDSDLLAVLGLPDTRYAPVTTWTMGRSRGAAGTGLDQGWDT